MFFTPSRRITTVAIAAASMVGTGLSADPSSASAPSGGVSVYDSVNGNVQGPAAEATAQPLAQGVDITAVSAAIDRAAQGSVGYAFRISAGGQLVGGGAGGHARRPLDGTQDKDGTPFTVDSRVEVQLPAVQLLLPARTSKGVRARRALAKVNKRVLSPAGVAPTSCKAVETKTATHIYNAANLAIGGTLVGAAADGSCGPARGLLLSATDLVRLAPSLQGGVGSAKGGWTTAAGQSDDGQASWQSGEGRFAGGREIHACVASAAGHELSIIFNAQIPGDASPCRILLDAINGSRTAS